MAEQCAAHRKDGTRCRGTARPGKRLCFIHDPELKNARQAGAAKGGRHKAIDHRVRRDLLTDRLEPQEVEGLLTRSLLQTAEGKLHPSVMSAIAAGVRAYGAIRQVADLEERIAALEEADSLREGKLA